jgi:hypothetical protein
MTRFGLTAMLRWVASPAGDEDLRLLQSQKGRAV